MHRVIVGVLAAGASLCLAAPAQAVRPLASVVPQQTAQRYGLERAWATQVELDRSRGRIAHITLQSGLLIVQTNQGAVHVLDAETRHTLWVAHVGRPGNVTCAPAASDRFVVSTNGSMLYLFDRPTGRVLWSKKLASVPSAGPAISTDRVFVPFVSGMMVSFRLPSDKRKEAPAEQLWKDNALNYAGKGLAYVAPIVTSSGVMWGTDAGYIYTVTPDTLTAVYRFKARNSVMAGLLYRQPFIYAASRDGYVYALREDRGTARWQFSIGSPIVETPLATNDGVYVIPETGGLYKLASDTGEELWAAPGAFHLLSASPTRLYTSDSAGRLLIFDAKSGVRLGSIATQNLPLKVFNRDNDRIYLATATGLVQCLREIGLKEPVWHGLTAVDRSAAEAEDADDAKNPKEAKPAADEGPDPFGADDKMPDDK